MTLFIKHLKGSTFSTMAATLRLCGYRRVARPLDSRSVLRRWRLAPLRPGPRRSHPRAAIMVQWPQPKSPRPSAGVFLCIAAKLPTRDREVSMANWGVLPIPAKFSATWAPVAPETRKVASIWSKARVVVCDGKFFAASSTRSPDGRAAILKLSQRALLMGFPCEKSYRSKPK
jgi:hypothetical protein